MPDDKNRGLYGKYKIERTDGRPVGQCIVLEVDDPNTWNAITVWAATVLREGYQVLGLDALELVEEARRKAGLTVDA